MTLRGDTVRLEPMAEVHVEALAASGLHPELWRWQPRAMAGVDEMREYVRSILREAQTGSVCPFVIVRNDDANIVGATRFMDIAPEHDRLEIGGTWLTPSAQRTRINTEVKLLMLQHAFETLGAVRVIFKTEALNERSRKAIERIGAVQEGTFRKHLTAADGRRRDMVYYAILDSEWPAVKRELERKLN